MIASLVDISRTLHAVEDVDLSNRDKQMISYWQRILDGVIYQLYFRGDFEKAKVDLLGLFERQDVNVANLAQASEKISKIRRIFEKLFDMEHPVRLSLGREDGAAGAHQYRRRQELTREEAS